MQRPLLVSLVTMCAALASVTCQAKIMYHYDLASLYWMSEVVAEVQEGEYKRENWMDVGEVTVLKAHKGKVDVGQKLKVAFSAFRREMPTRNSVIVIVDGKTIEKKPEPLKFKKAVMFLKWYERYKAYLPVADGARLIGEDGEVYGFEQYGNPGPYVLKKDKPDYLVLKDGEKYSEEQLSKELELAIKHTAEFEKVLKGEDLKAIAAYLVAPWAQKNDIFPEKRYALARDAAERLAKEAPSEMIEELLNRKPPLDFYTKSVFESEAKRRQAKLAP